MAMTSSDMLPLRCFMVGASSCGILYNLLQPKPLIPPAAWGIFFIAGHGLQITRLLLARQHITMDDREHELYERAFMPFGFSPRAFTQLLEVLVGPGPY
jgi:hypothetical protein